jgi:hypothetical protein
MRISLGRAAMTHRSPKLANALTQEQVDIANRFHRQLSRWQISDKALFRLRDCVPEWDAAACLLKSVAINSIYGTNVYATIRVAEHIASIFAGRNADAAKGDELVERIARLPDVSTRPRNCISFASKFCHFFIDEEKFPLFDEAARRALKYHLGPKLYVEDRTHPYIGFRENLRRLREESRINCSDRQLDHYLWITGLYINWLRGRQINAELRSVLANPSRSQAHQLNAFLPPKLERRFLRNRETAGAVGSAAI